MSLPAPRALIFDWDNTLVDTWPVIHQALHDTFVDFNMPTWTLDESKARVRKSMRDSFPQLFGKDWVRAGDLYQQHYRAHHLDMLQPLPGAEEMLSLASKLGLPSVVVSNKKGNNLRTEVEHLAWNGWFAAIIGSDDASRDKPHPDPVHLALEYIDLPPGPEVWFVGDSEIDLETAIACGCTAILFGDYAPARAEFTPTHYHGFAYAMHVLNHAALSKILLSNAATPGVKLSS